MNILYFGPIPLYPKGHGNIATVHQYIKRLRFLGHKVHYVLINEMGQSEENLFLSQKYVDSLDVLPYKSTDKRDQYGYYLFDSKYYDGLGEKICLLCKKYKIDAIICTYIFQSKILEYVPSNILKIIDTHDKMSDRHLMLRLRHIKDEFFFLYPRR